MRNILPDKELRIQWFEKDMKKGSIHNYILSEVVDDISIGMIRVVELYFYQNDQFSNWSLLSIERT